MGEHGLGYDTFKLGDITKLLGSNMMSTASMAEVMGFDSEMYDVMMEAVDKVEVKVPRCPVEIPGVLRCEVCGLNEFNPSCPKCGI